MFCFFFNLKVTQQWAHKKIPTDWNFVTACGFWLDKPAAQQQIADKFSNFFAIEDRQVNPSGTVPKQTNKERISFISKPKKWL